jgi:branched-chain amino acid transport system permease protein
VTGLFNPAFWTFVAVIAGIYAIMALGLYVQFSLAGLPNFGHVAFMAVAAYTMAILVVRFELPLPLASLAGLVGALVLALLLGVPTLRLRSDYLAIATVAAGEIVRYLAMNLPELTGGPVGSMALLGPDQFATYNGAWIAMLDRLRRPLAPLFGAAPSRDAVTAVIVWGVLLLLILAIARLQHSPWGRVLRAIREDDTTVAAVGKNVVAF